LNISSITVTVQPPSGAVASVSGGKLNVDYKNISFSGKESITIRACDNNGNCSTQQFEIEVAGDVVVYNAVSPDGKNPILRLEFIDTLSPKNQVSIYNRWGDEVFSISDYDNKTRVFAGLTNSGSKLPVGTYFYKVVLTSGNKTLTGFLSLKY
jgi:gliding motility-associated-like protein